jgi:XTP/dITP diphosphohydrolase
VKRLVVASTNAGKIREVSLALSDLPDWNVESLPDLPEIAETAATFLENATLKATHYSRFIGALTLADDSGLCVHALDGRPGLHSARYALRSGAQRWLLAELAALGRETAAHVYCAFAIARLKRLV